AAADPAVPSRFSDRDVLVLDVSDLSDGRVTLDVDLAHLAGRKPHLRVTSLLGHELRGGAGRTDELTAATPLQLEVVDRGAERDALQWQSVAGDDVRGRSRDHLRSDLETVGREDVALLPVHVVKERDPGGTVRVVLDRRDARGHSHLVAAEVDDALEPLVTAAHVPRGDPDLGDLDSEERGDGPRDLDLVGRAVHFEADRVRGFLHPRGLFGDQGLADDAMRFHHLPPSVSTTRFKASFETTTVPWLMTS